MILDKDNYRDIILVLDTLMQKGEFDGLDGLILLNDERWAAVEDWLLSRAGKAYIYVSFRFYLIDKGYARFLRSSCLKAIERIDKEEHDRMVDLNYKIKGILIGWISLTISLVSLSLSIWVALRQFKIIPGESLPLE